MLVDTHAHIHFKNFNQDRDAVIQRARDKLDFFAEIGVNSTTNLKALALASQHPGFIYPTFGLHPTDATPEEIETVKQQITTHLDQIIAIGEIGLDFHHETDPQKQQSQTQMFKEILDFAEPLKKPIIIHSREAEQQAFDILSSYKFPSLIMHCYSGSLPLATKCLDAGYWISVPTIVTFAQEKQDLTKHIGLDRLLLETDAPFLSPLKNKRNEPSFVKYSAQKISQLLSIPYPEVETKTTNNAYAAYLLEKQT